MSAEPFPTDPNLPHLQVAGDPELMREVFQRHLRSLDEEEYQVRECRIFHVRYLRTLRCLLQYDLRLEEVSTGRERSQWVTGTMFEGDRARQIWEYLRQSGPGRGIPSASPPLLAPLRWIRGESGRSEPEQEVSVVPRTLFEPFSYISELKMLVQVFPYDHRLPALPLLMEGPPPELEPLLLERFGPGDWRVEAWDVEPLKYMAELRATFRLTAQARDAATGRTEKRRFYAKVYHDEEVGEQTYQVLRALWDKAGAGDASFTGGKTIAYLGGLRVLVQEEAHGTPLGEMLFRGDEAVPAVRKVARALAALHLGRVVAPLRRYPLQKEVALLQRRGGLLRVACPQRGPEIEEIVGAVVAGLEEVPPAPTHCDLKLDHVLLDGDDLTLLDFDVFAGADPILDVASISARIVSMPLSSPLPHERARTLARTFAEEYFAHAPKAWRARLPFHYAGALLRVASGIFSVRPPGWPDKVEALLEEAKDSLEGRVW
jgi:hypothetical protein